MVDRAFGSLLRHLENIANGGENTGYTQEEVKVAVTTLLCRVIVCDGWISPKETACMNGVMQRIFGEVERDEKWRPILDSMKDGSASSEPLFATTAIILESLGKEKRRQVVDMMVYVARSDGEVVEEEITLINHVAEMLKVDDVELAQPSPVIAGQGMSNQT